jgi:peptide/nickel transport system substrate-binding protein
LRQIFRDVRFRQAMSLAINRDEINKLVYLGNAKPRQATINSSASFFKQEWADNCAQYDVKKAEELMLEMGLKRGADGNWLRPDGKPLQFMLEYPPQEGPKKEVNELVGKYWNAFGVQVDVQGREKTYLLTRCQGGQQDCSSWHANRELERAAWVEGWYGSKLGVGGGDCLTYAQGWKDWINSGGKTGVEPPAEAKEMLDAYYAWQKAGWGTPEYTAAAIKVHDLMAKSLYVIGTCGEGVFPVVVSNNLENAFTDDQISGKERFWWGAAPWLLWTLNGAQLFLKDA